MQILFKDPKIEMGMFGRFVVRLFSYMAYGALAAMAVVLVFAELSWMEPLGLLIVLFLIDKLIHINSGRKSLIEDWGDGDLNLVDFLSPTCLALLEKTIDRGTFLGNDLAVAFLKEALDSGEASSFIKDKNLLTKTEKGVDEYLKSHTKGEVKTLEEVKRVLEGWVHEAALVAKGDGVLYIEPKYLFLKLKLGVNEEGALKFLGELGII